MIYRECLKEFSSLPFPRYQALTLFLVERLRAGETDAFMQIWDQISNDHVPKILDALRDLSDLGNSEWLELVRSFRESHSDCGIFFDRETLQLDYELFETPRLVVDTSMRSSQDDCLGNWRTVLTTSVHETWLSSSPLRPGSLETDGETFVEQRSPAVEAGRKLIPKMISFTSTGTITDPSITLPSPVSDSCKKKRKKKKSKKQKKAATDAAIPLLAKADSAIDIQQLASINSLPVVLSLDGDSSDLDCIQKGFVQKSESVDLSPCKTVAPKSPTLSLFSLDSVQSAFSEAPSISFSLSFELSSEEETVDSPVPLLNLYDVDVRPTSFVNLPPITSNELDAIRHGKVLPDLVAKVHTSKASDTASLTNWDAQERLLENDSEFQLYLYYKSQNIHWPVIPQLN